MSDSDTIKAFVENTFPVDPPLPEDFDNTANDDRPGWQIKFLWARPYIQTMGFSGSSKYKKQWLESWPNGKRFDVRCLDGGAWDRATTWGMFGSLEEAIDCCKTGPSWRVQS